MARRSCAAVRHDARWWDVVKVVVVEAASDPGGVPADNADVGDSGVDPLEQLVKSYRRAIGIDFGSA